MVARVTVILQVAGGIDDGQQQEERSQQRFGEATRVVYLADLKVKIPIIGKQAEAYGLKKIGDEFKKQSDFLTTWLREK